MSNQARLILDIETVGVDFESLDDFSREHIRKYAPSPEELEEAKNRLSFSPLTGEIVCIGILNPDSGKGISYLKTEQSLPPEIIPGIRPESGSEKEILFKFWDAASHYNTFVTFNGRSFDIPFLMIRSAIHGVRPTKNLMSNRYTGSQPSSALHIDLFDQLTFYGATRTRSSLHFWMKAFGLKSPKDDGVTGDNVKELYSSGRILDIAKYNAGDLVATRDLYEKWEKYLSF
jgi:DNA polymerase elongation subunit (family B)